MKKCLKKPFSGLLCHFVGYAMVGYYHNVFGGVIFLEYSVVISASISIFLCLLCAMQIKLYFSHSLVEVISDFLMDFACLMTRKAQLMLTVIVINHSLQLTQTSCLAFCLPVCFSFTFVRLLM